MNDKKDLLEKYTRQPYPALVKPTAPAPELDEGEYKGLVKHIQKSGHNPRFRIIDRNGNSYGCGYSYLLGWLYTPPDTLTIQTTTHLFTLTGKSLKHIEDALMDEDMKELREFNPTKDTLPADGETVIEKLTIKSLWADKEETTD